MVWFLFALGSAIVQSLGGVFEKKALQHEHSLSFSTAYAFAALVFSLPLLLIADFSNFSTDLLFLTYGATVLSTVGFWFSAKGMKHLDLSISSPLLVSSLLFLPFLAFFLTGERLSAMQIGGILLIFLGVLFLESIVQHGKLFHIPTFDGNRYVHLTLAAAFLFSLAAIADKLVLVQVSPFTYLFIVHLFMAINSLVLLVILDKKFKRDLTQIFSQDLKITVLSAFLAVVHRLLFVIAVAQAFVSIAVAVKRLHSLFSVFLGGRLFHEHNIRKKALACVVMLLGAALLALS